MKLTLKEILNVIFTSATIWSMLIILTIMIIQIIFNKDISIITFIFVGFSFGTFAMRFDKDRTIKEYDRMLQKSFRAFDKLYETIKIGEK